MIGLDAPGPGNSVFQTRFSSGPQVVGRPVAALTPRPPGPRNCGQSARAALATRRSAEAEILRAGTAEGSRSDRCLLMRNFLIHLFVRSSDPKAGERITAPDLMQKEVISGGLRTARAMRNVSPILSPPCPK